jgi:rhodanese-related sulfurtransferase
MNLRKHFLEAATLVIAALLCALVSNALASRERKMALVGTYPNALKVPASEPAPVPVLPAVETSTSATTSTTTATTTAATTATAAIPPVPMTTTAPAIVPTIPVPTTTTTTTAIKPAPTATPTSAPHAPPPAPADVAKFQPHPDKPYIEIAHADVAALHAAGALFLDARRTNIYEQGHIAGAKTYSVWESDVEDKVRALWDQRQDPKEQALPIVVYCSGGDCEDSHMLAQKLWGAQFNNVYVYKDGFPDWQAHGGAVHTGTNP